MNPVDFWDKQIALWDTQQKCGLCWTFEAPLIESAITVVQPTEGKECCVNVFFVSDKSPAFSNTLTYNNQTGFVNQSTCTTNFQLLFLVMGDIGMNNWTEIKGHNESVNKWNNILYPLQECLKCDAQLAFCEILGSQYRVTQWSAMQVVNYLDNSYTGYRLSVSFQTTK